MSTYCYHVSGGINHVFGDSSHDYSMTFSVHGGAYHALHYVLMDSYHMSMDTFTMSMDTFTYHVYGYIYHVQVYGYIYHVYGSRAMDTFTMYVDTFTMSRANSPCLTSYQNK
jgi:hypothetical protein